MIIGKKNFDTDHETYIMGILNVTPDSFSDGGNFNCMDAALRHTEEMLAEGADIIDIGGESTRPGHVQITDQEEIDRVAPIIEAVKARFDVPVSLDTYKSAVAEAGIAVGADLINDIWGLKYDPKMADVIAKADAACCLMHNRDNSDYGDFLSEWYQETAECVELAKKAGIADDRIILDPGVGFGKTYEQNLTTIKYMDDLKKLGYPLLLGTSRKSVIGLTLDTPVTDRAVGTAVTTVFAVQQGYAFVRVHDIKANKQAIQMTKAILNA
ncbi:dihydropteroate synthase [Eubacterium ramulus]|jgi:dihydropteroate synthase|uniref:Dihydropteroate synthase n=1 Tax=Eubacterium ramulus TaxID=39490 RepID=A0A2V1JPR7_EUBRA|nr:MULTISPECIES: dihydropteroate synthase [Clostridia]PWE86910.1 dihydropteroate synthase [Eubacterium ramulus]RHV69268.1 dihydropteroate synthase [Roseburia sp. OM02-15]